MADVKNEQNGDANPAQTYDFSSDDEPMIIKKIRLTKSQKKLKKYEDMVAKKKATRKLKKDRKRVRLLEEGIKEEVTHVNKKEKLRLMKEKLEESMKTGQRVCIDLSLEGVMSAKQTSRLVQQLGRLYGANRKADKPLWLHFTSLDPGSYLYKECVRKNCGFEKYMITMTEKSHAAVFPTEEIVYLSPDSETTLEEISKDKVYVIGGLVDDSVDKDRTKNRAAEKGLKTAKLPIEKYMRKSGSIGNFSKVLTVNQVFDILLVFYNTQDWRKALEAGVPKRSGYVLKDDQ
ncbi:hypothetical protein CAPTEDRAFT_158169 [Capitella teleta]|uniref:tRNA methyltransferase 10 homolog B n=1 Tax=Capitella teleta TaxID=283909 RepID=R7UUL7_CAPTE|nr:hypothetical protein CAPTEDRAFT_158169 [Capitella teleta]|eukprot:ELU10338.1 hypothetical protein CAPTEDRAFT_158169 [Capitella teleta]